MISRLLIMLAMLVSPAAAQPAASGPVSPASSTAWAFHGGGPLLGVAPQLPPPPMRLRWTYRADADGDAAIEGAAAVVGDTVFVADEKGGLHALDLTSGRKRWIYHSADAAEAGN